MLTTLTGLLMIAALIAAQAFALWAIWYAVMIVVRRLPMIGRRHRHRDWERLNGTGPQFPGPT